MTGASVRLLLLLLTLTLLMTMMTAITADVDVAADSAHEHSDGDCQQDEAGAAERRHDDDPEQASVRQVGDTNRRRLSLVGRGTALW